MNKICYFLIAAAAIVFAACGDDEEDLPVAVDMVEIITPEKTDVVFPNSSCSMTIGVDANCYWSASTIESWLTCTNNNGTRTNSSELILTVTTNKDSRERTATVLLKNTKGAVKATIRVTQRGCTIKDGHEYVDLGLPSGLLWAACNVGADNPEDCGNYYAWGEPATKSSYDWDTYLNNWGGAMTDKSDCGTYKDPLKDYVYPNNKSIAGTQYDIALKEWGGTWRMPTFDDFKEIKDNTIVIWTTQEGVKGCKVTGPNGNFIFLPAAGWHGGKYVSNGPDSSEPEGEYWSASPEDDLYYGHADYAIRLSFSQNFCSNDHFDLYTYASRCWGRSVRPVTEP